jgi:hypothetical protein
MVRGSIPISIVAPEDFNHASGEISGVNGDEAVFKVFELGADHAEETVNIQFNRYEIDSWDDEYLNLFVNEQEVFSAQMAHSNKPRDDTDGGTPLGNIGNTDSSYIYNDEVHTYEV